MSKPRQNGFQYSPLLFGRPLITRKYATALTIRLERRIRAKKPLGVAFRPVLPVSVTQYILTYIEHVRKSLRASIDSDLLTYQSAMPRRRTS